MFKKDVSSFGEFEKISITHPTRHCAMTIIPEFGANLQNLRLEVNGKGISVIDGVETAEELKNDPAFKSALLSPWPNRIKDGLYSFQDENYQLAVNEIPRNHAIHGLVYNRPFTVEQLELGEESAKAVLKYEYPGDNPGFPFPFTQWIHFNLGLDYLNVLLKVTNNYHTSIPIGMGWHPYFDFNVPVDEVSLKLPEVEEIIVDDRMIPIGSKQDFTRFQNRKPIGDYVLDSCFKLKDPPPVARTFFGSKAKNIEIEYWQETGDRKYDFLQVFTPKTRKSLAVEPMTCAIDAFNNLTGLNLLDPDDSMEASFGLKASTFKD